MNRVARPAGVVLLLMIAGIGVIAGANPCLACSCASTRPAEVLADADAAFVGRAVETRVDDEGTTQVFEVDGVYRGELGPTVEVWAQIGTGVVDSCAVTFPEGERRALVLSRDGGRWTTSICSLITETQLERIVGEPRPPSGPADPPEPPASGPPGVVSSARQDGVPPWSILLLGALIAIGGTWLVLTVVSRRRGGGEPETGDGG
ncbi:MAG TPA: hypothetical protein VIB62_09190 [Actinomycetota bacterium]|jgi:hypothetical protein